MICLTATTPAIAKMANRCDEPVFGGASISIDKVATNAAEAQKTGVDAAAQTAFRQVLNRVLLSSANLEEFTAVHDIEPKPHANVCRPKLARIATYVPHPTAGTLEHTDDSNNVGLKLWEVANIIRHLAWHVKQLLDLPRDADE